MRTLLLPAVSCCMPLCDVQALPGTVTGGAAALRPATSAGAQVTEARDMGEAELRAHFAHVSTPPYLAHVCERV